MFALAFRFPAGRYHATPWRRNVNEADVAWLPEPWRLLRALIATWHRKRDRSRWPKDDLDLAALIDALAGQAPVYRLPQGAIHAHTRHYMPAPTDKALVFDAFARLPPEESLVAAWPDVVLSDRLFDLAADLAAAIGYLGRAESWVEAEALRHWDSREANCLPEPDHRDEGGKADGHRPPESELVRVIAALPAPAYAAFRIQARTETENRLLATWAKKAKPTKKAIARELAPLDATLPERLVDALALDTAVYQGQGWTRPPASRELVYRRVPLAPTPLAPTPLAPTPRHRRPSITAEDPDRLPTVARFVLAGRPRPRIEDAVRIGELVRRAALSRFGWHQDAETGRWHPKAPPVISGRDAGGCCRDVASHSHAFWLSEDADDDGEIDHVTIYAAAGLYRHVRERLDGLTRLWLPPDAPVPADPGGDHDGSRGRREWRLALEGFGRPQDFASASRLFGLPSITGAPATRRWRSATPFLAAGHLKAGGYPAELRRLLARRNIVGAAAAAQVEVKVLCKIKIHGQDRRALHFHRFRSRGGEAQYDTAGALLCLTFPEPVEGPLALGYGSHFGLGLFQAVPSGSPQAQE